MNSFVRKYGGMAGMKEDFVKSLFTFRPAIIGAK